MRVARLRMESPPDIASRPLFALLQRLRRQPLQDTRRPGQPGPRPEPVNQIPHFQEFRLRSAGGALPRGDSRQDWRNSTKPCGGSEASPRAPAAANVPRGTRSPCQARRRMTTRLPDGAREHDETATFHVERAPPGSGSPQDDEAPSRRTRERGGTATFHCGTRAAGVRPGAGRRRAFPAEPGNTTRRQRSTWNARRRGQARRRTTRRPPGGPGSGAVASTAGVPGASSQAPAASGPR